MKLFRRVGQNTSDWAFFQRFEIPNLDDPEETYLTRWRLIQTPWFAFYLHRMTGPDSRADLHDHPWNFLSIVLRGGYAENTPEGMREVTRFNLKRAEDFHSIRYLLRHPTWTFVITGRRRRVWGYKQGDGWVQFDQHPTIQQDFERAMAWRRARGV